MNISKILKERNHIWKLSVVVLMSMAVMYMVPIHMSSAMMGSNGFDDDLVVPAHMSSTEVSSNGFDDYPSEVPVDFISEYYEVAPHLLEDFVGDIIHDKQDTVDTNSIDKMAVDVRDDKDAVDIETANKKDAMNAESECEEKEPQTIFVSDSTASVNGESKLSCYNVVGDNWVLTNLITNDFVTFHAREDFDCRGFLSEAVRKLLELDEKFSVKAFVDENKFFIASPEEIEDEVSLKMLENLPKKGEKGFEQILEIPSESKLSEEDKVTYAEIKKIVGDTIAEIEKSGVTGAKKQLTIANALYVWVSQNIKYIERGNIDVFTVFRGREGVCRDYTRLLNLMLKMAGIPSMYCVSLCVEDGSFTHAFSAIYIDGEDPIRSGWTLLDATFAEPTHLEMRLFKKNEDLNCDVSSSLSEKVQYVLININEKNVEKYYFDIRDAVESSIEKYKDDIENKINEINIELAEKIIAINSNPDYIDLKKIQSLEIKIGSEDKAFSQGSVDSFLYRLRLNITLTEKEKKALDKIDGETRVNNFPAFYDEGSSFQEANRKFVSSFGSHSVSFCEISMFKETQNYIIDQVTGYEVNYFLSGNRGQAKLFLSGKLDKGIIENFTIPRELLKYGFTISIGRNIKSLILQGNEKIDLTVAYDLESITVTPESEYVVENGHLYRKNSDATKGELVDLFAQSYQINGWKYRALLSKDRQSVIGVEVYSDDRIRDINELPPEISALPVKIGNGIRSIKIRGDEMVELCGVDIEEVNVSESKRYIVEDGVLYEKDADGNKGSQVVVFNKEIDKDEYKYFIKPLNTILICGNGETLLEDFHIPQELFDQYDNIEIGPGIKSFVLKGTQRVSCYKLRAKDLVDVDVSRSMIYEMGFDSKK